jgi:sortase A
VTVVDDQVAEDQVQAGRPAPEGPGGPGRTDGGDRSGPAGPPAGKTAGTDHPPVAPGRRIASTVLFVLAVFLIGATVNVVWLSRLSYHSAQQTGFDQLRGQLAHGTAPVAETVTPPTTLGTTAPTLPPLNFTLSGSGTKKAAPTPTTTTTTTLPPTPTALALGTPMAVLDIPAIGLHQVVVFEGTTSGILTKGPGHQRDTVFPGQAGTSVIQGRAAAYGGPFEHIDDLVKGDKVTVSTGQGTATYKVIDSRVAGDPEPPALKTGQGRLTLTTARGSAFMPSGVLRVDADLTSTAFATPTLPDLGPLPADQQPMGVETDHVSILAWWLEALVLVAVAGVVVWRRWGRWQTWLVVGPVAAMVGYFAAGELALLLPNLM